MANNPANWPAPNYDDPETAGSLTGSLAASIILGTITVIAVIARFYARIAIVRRVGLDDLFIIIALGFAIAFNVIHEIGIRRDHYGRHIWDVPFAKLEDVAFIGFMATEFYLIATGLIKISILLFYRRVLRGSHGSLLVYNRINYVLMFIVAACTIAIGLTLLFTCLPVEALWKQYNPEYQEEYGDCEDDPPAVLASSYYSLVTDFVIIIFPLLFVRHIQIRKREKWALRALFLVCSIACIAATIRTVFITLMLYGPDGGDLPYYGFWALLWGTVEIYTAIICACAPAIKPIYTTYFGSKGHGSGPSTSTSSPSMGKRSLFWGSSKRATELDSSTVAAGRHEQDLESDKDMELLKHSAVGNDGSKAVDIWDERQGLPAGIIGHSVLDIEADRGAGFGSEMTEGGANEKQLQNQSGVMKRVDVEVRSYQPNVDQILPTVVPRSQA